MTYDKSPNFSDAQLMAVSEKEVQEAAANDNHIDYMKWKLENIKRAKREMMQGRTITEIYELQLIGLFNARDKAEAWIQAYLKQFEEVKK